MKKKRKGITSLLMTAVLLLGIKDGYVALWKDEDPQPWKILPLRCDSLPVADQLMLKKGIVIRSERELWELLEDYS